MDETQKDIVLYVFKCMNEIHGKTFIQKLFYILKNQITEVASFEYFPYNYGPFSKELNQAVNDLIDEGLLAERKAGDYFIYSITDKGSQESGKQKSISSTLQNKIKMVCEHVKGFKPREILEYVYKKYPGSLVQNLINIPDRPPLI